MPTHFTPEALKFLRGLARNNDRDWFEARREIYERALRAPMLALVDEISHAMQAFAPAHVRPPHKIMMRIYRDIRFSPNKNPYKTHLAAWWAERGMEKTSGGGFYLQVSPSGVMVSAGVYMPEREQLLRIRQWMSTNHKTYRAGEQKLLRARSLGFENIDPQALTRMPKGFAADDPAGDLLRAKNWGVHAFLPADLAFEPALSREVIRRMRAAAPLVDSLNGAIRNTGETSNNTRSEMGRQPFF